MRQAVKEYGGTEFKVPPGGHFRDVPYGNGMIAEYFRDGTGPGTGGPVVVVDGGFGRVDPDKLPRIAVGREAAQTVTTSTGRKKVIPKKADTSTISSGGLY